MRVRKLLTIKKKETKRIKKKKREQTERKKNFFATPNENKELKKRDGEKKIREKK